MDIKDVMESKKYTITRSKEIFDCHDCDYHSCYMDRDTVRLECSCHHPDLSKILGSFEFKGQQIPRISRGVESGEGFPEWCPL